MESGQKSAGIAFNILFDEKVAACPKTLHKNNQKTKEPLTLDQIEKKQLLAERRRQARIEARLKRMQEREESTKKLAESVELLMQQQSLRTGELKTSEVTKMSQQEIMKTANDVAKRFKEMQQQLLGMDLKVDDTVKRIPVKKTHKSEAAGKVKGHSNTEVHSCIHYTSAVARSATVGDHERQRTGMVFEIPIDEFKVTKKCKKKPHIAGSGSEKSCRQLTAEELNEKQQQAAERRQKRIEQRVKNTRKRREALMELQAKINIYQQHQEAMKNGDQENMLSPKNAASLANEIADGFSNIHSRYKTDLERADGFYLFH